MRVSPRAACSSGSLLGLLALLSGCSLMGLSDPGGEESRLYLGDGRGGFRDVAKEFEGPFYPWKLRILKRQMALARWWARRGADRAARGGEGEA